MSDPVASAPALPVPSFAAHIVKPEKIGPPKSILVFGRAGTRKTSMIAELIKRPGVRRILWIDADNGTEVFINDPEVWQAVQEERIQVLPIDVLNPMAFGQITSTIQEVSAVDYGYDFVVLDTLNGMQAVAVNYFLATTFNGKGQLDTRGGWMEVSKWTDAMARMLHNCPHTTGVFILHESTGDDDESVTRPKLQGSVKESIDSIPSIVARLSWQKKAPTAEGVQSTETELVALLGEQENVASKNRYMLPPRMNNFTLLALYEEIDRKRSARPALAPVPDQTPADAQSAA